jgi:hypothetical protein
LAWTADGRDIVFGRAGWLAKSGWLWKISARGGEPERLQFGQEGTEPSIRGNRLVYARQVTNVNIWRRQLESLHFSGPSESSFRPQQWRVARISRLTGTRSPSNQLAAALTKYGPAAMTGAIFCSSRTSTRHGNAALVARWQADSL